MSQVAASKESANLFCFNNVLQWRRHYFSFGGAIAQVIWGRPMRSRGQDPVGDLEDGGAENAGVELSLIHI